MSYGRNRTAVAVRIANGATASGEVSVGSLRIVGVAMPAAWTAGNITFQAVVRQAASNPPTPEFKNVVDAAGAAIAIATPAADTYLALPDTLALIALGVIKVVAGAAQGAQRDFFLVCVDY